ncbi:MAG: flagellar protein [Defluviitaleaceae bacterium]|nr:flagellar protein [Defluviitaleaceae bacterium]
MQIFPGTNKVNSSINPVADEHQLRNTPQASNPGVSFGDVLGNKIAENQPIIFSKHASLRLNSRNINLSGEQIARVENGLTQARQKGINDSLVVVDDIRLVVNVKSKTVITAMQSVTDNNIFTNIDGAVIV